MTAKIAADAACRHRAVLWVAGAGRYVCCPERWWAVALPPSTERDRRAEWPSSASTCTPSPHQESTP